MAFPVYTASHLDICESEEGKSNLAQPVGVKQAVTDEIKRRGILRRISCSVHIVSVIQNDNRYIDTLVKPYLVVLEERRIQTRVSAARDDITK